MRYRSLSVLVVTGVLASGLAVFVAAPIAATAPGEAAGSCTAAADVPRRGELRQSGRLPAQGREADARPHGAAIRGLRGRRATEDRDFRARRRARGGTSGRARRAQLPARVPAGRCQSQEPRVRDLPRHAARHGRQRARHQRAADPADRQHPRSRRSGWRDDTRDGGLADCARAEDAGHRGQSAHELALGHAIHISPRRA